MSYIKNSKCKSCAITFHKKNDGTCGCSNTDGRKRRRSRSRSKRRRSSKRRSRSSRRRSY